MSLVFRICMALALATAAFAQEEAREATRMYYVAFLRPDPARKPVSKEDEDRIQNLHMANILKMAGDGVLAAAGPFANDPPTINGVFVMKAKSLNEARSIASTDPAVREHQNAVDVHAWRGPQGIGDKYFRLHREHPNTPENMGMQPILLLMRGPSWNQSATQRVVLLAQHQRFIDELRSAGKLGAAGPVEDDPEMIGIVVFHRIPLEEARQAITQDPAVKAGVLSVEAHRWWSADHVLPW